MLHVEASGRAATRCGVHAPNPDEEASAMSGKLIASAPRRGYALHPSPQGLDLAKLAGAMRRRAGLILLVAGIPVALACLYLLFAPPRYTASVRMLLDPRGLQVVGNDISSRSASTDGSLTEAESQQYVVASLGVLSKVVDAERLASDPLFGARPPGLRQRIGALLGLGGEPADPHAVALRALEKSIAVKRADRSYVIDLYVSTEDRDASARIANAIAETYLAQEVAARTDAARRAGASLSGRLNELRDQVLRAESQVEQYKAAYRIVGAAGSLVDEQQLREANSQLMTARARSTELRSRLEQIRAAQQRQTDTESMPEATGSTTITALRSQYAEAKKLEADLSAQLGPRHPWVASASAQAREARRQIQDEINRIRQTTQTELDRARSTEAELERKYQGLKQDVVTTNHASVRLRELERDAESTRSVYQAFLVRAKELDEQKGVDTANTRIIAHAVRPMERGGPSPLLLLAGSALLGLGLGASAAWAREQLDDRLSGVRAFSQAAGLPVFAVVPRAPAFARSRPEATDRAVSHIEPDRLRALTRIARTLEMREGASRTVLVLALEHTQEASLLASDLGLVVAAQSRNVLLIEATPQDHRADEHPVDRALRTSGEPPPGAVQVAAEDGSRVKVLPFWHFSADRFGEEQFADLMQSHADAPHTIIIDASPDDPRLPSLLDLADTVALVVQDGVSRRATLVNALASLQPLDPPLGLVLIG
jgi:succinoglycan biosynthesis transport protein ExoP